MGNLALRGERAEANWPRSPLVIVEVQEQPFALKRETIFAVDERTYNDSPRVQMSNFRFYQDRETGDVVLFLPDLDVRHFHRLRARRWPRSRSLGCASLQGRVSATATRSDTPT